MLLLLLLKFSSFGCSFISSSKSLCGEEEIRTLETLLTFTRFPGVPLQPLEHLSKLGRKLRKKYELRILFFVFLVQNVFFRVFSAFFVFFRRLKSTKKHCVRILCCCKVNFLKTYIIYICQLFGGVFQIGAFIAFPPERRWR